MDSTNPQVRQIVRTRHDDDDDEMQIDGKSNSTLCRSSKVIVVVVNLGI